MRYAQVNSLTWLEVTVEYFFYNQVNTVASLYLHLQWFGLPSFPSFPRRTNRRTQPPHRNKGASCHDARTFDWMLPCLSWLLVGRLDVHWLASYKSWKTSTDIGSEAHRCIGSLGSARGYLGLKHPPHGAMFSCLLHPNCTILLLPLPTSLLLCVFPIYLYYFASHTVSRSGTTDRYPIIRCSCPIRLFCCWLELCFTPTWPHAVCIFHLHRIYTYILDTLTETLFLCFHL
ncbi:hypothetical protein B0T13DRAFT_144427 [Neurospora crassa]|nr:hypothetical protein B0T13DRAFT_144427 [Neurospora crassa]